MGRGGEVCDFRNWSSDKLQVKLTSPENPGGTGYNGSVYILPFCDVV